MAVQTPCHPEGLAFVRDHLFLDRSVAVVAIDPAVDMNAVVEVDEIRNAVEAIPFKRLLLDVAGANGIQKRAIGPDLRMTRHTCLCGRDAGARRLFDGR